MPGSTHPGTTGQTAKPTTNQRFLSIPAAPTDQFEKRSTIGAIELARGILRRAGRREPPDSSLSISRLTVGWALLPVAFDRDVQELDA